MPLPIFDTPIHSLELPSNGQRVEFRPFLVKEQKQLLMASEADSDQQIRAIEEIVRACCFDRVDVSRLASFDIEFLFMNIRARSIGERVDLTVNCGHCQASQTQSLDITEVQVEKDADHTDTLDLGNEVLVKMRYPRLRDVEKIMLDTTPDAVIQLIASNIDTIWQGDDMFSALDYSTEELTEFVESLSPLNFEKFEAFFGTLPVLRHRIEWDCKACEKHNTVMLEGIQSFFV